jgi:spore coat-associated protein N
MQTFFAKYYMYFLGALASFAIAGVAMTGSGAYFTSTTANPTNLFTAGNLAHSNSKNGSAIFTTNPKLKPGDTNTGSVTIANTGDIPGTFTLSKSNLVDTPGANGGNLSSVLQLLIKDGSTTVYSGSLTGFTSVALDGDLSTAGVQAFPISGGNATHTYDFTVTFPDAGAPASATTGDNAFKSSITSVQFNWNAVS